LKELLSIEYIEYERSGMKFNYNSVISMLSEEDDTESIMFDFKVISITDTVIQALYSTKIHKEDSFNDYCFRSSLWRIEDNNWKMYFH